MSEELLIAKFVLDWQFDRVGMNIFEFSLFGIAPYIPKFMGCRGLPNESKQLAYTSQTFSQNNSHAPLNLSKNHSSLGEIL